MKTLWILPFVVFITWISLGCDCIMTPLKKHIKTTKYIITGKVVALLDKPEDHYPLRYDTTRSHRVKIAVTDCYKGELKNGQVIEIDSDHSNCELFFKKDSLYLLFLNKETNSEHFRERTCSYSEELKNAAAYINVIERQTHHKRKK